MSAGAKGHAAPILSSGNSEGINPRSESAPRMAAGTKKTGSRGSSLAERRARFSLAPSLSVDYNCSKILPHLYLGGHEMTTEVAMLRELNISHVLSVTQEPCDHFPGEFVYKHVPMLDSVEADVLAVLEPAFAFIDLAKAAGTACLVHCSFGMSRSPSIVIAYLMRSDEGLSLYNALRTVKRLRPVTAPNYGFMAQLLTYEQNLRGSISVDLERYRADRTADPTEFMLSKK